jgi:hypothetical protein
MNKSKFTSLGITLLAVILLPLASLGQDVIEIQVAPNVLNLQNNGQVVTVHTDIPFCDVVAETVSMNGIAISSWKDDNQGNFVAKFLMSEIVNLPLNIGEYNTLTLDGTLTNGGTFTGSDDIMVVNNIPKGKNQ